LASIADRYGKRIAYFQSLPTIENVEMKYAKLTNAGSSSNAFLNQWNAGAAWGNAQMISDQTSTKICPIYEDGTAL
jgi:hypothetical protein